MQSVLCSIPTGNNSSFGELDMSINDLTGQQRSSDKFGRLLWPLVNTRCIKGHTRSWESSISDQSSKLVSLASDQEVIVAGY